MEIKISTPELKKHIGKKIRYRTKGSSIWDFATIHEIFSRQVNIGSDWVPFDKFASIVLVED